MFKYFKKVSCTAGVSSTLQQAGMSKELTHRCVDSFPEFFTVIIETTTILKPQQRNIIAALVFTIFINEHLGDDIPYNYLDIQAYIYEALKFQLKVSADWFDIAKCLSLSLHIILGEKMPSDDEIRKEFEPSSLEFNHDIHLI